MLTNEETSQLLARAKSGDDFAKEQLVTLNSPLIKSIVKRYLNKGAEYDDLYQLGAMGLIKAINNYSAEYNVKFTTYAVPMIAGEIKRFLRDDGSIKVSRSIKHNAIIIKNYLNSLDLIEKNNLSIDELSTLLNIDREDIVLALEAGAMPLSLNEKSQDDEISLMDKVPDKFSPDKLLDRIALRELISKLDEKERKIILMRYFYDKTQSEIAKELGVSQVQVSRMENKILQDMKNDL